MAYELDIVDVWTSSVEDRPGGLAGVLEKLAEAGVNLQFVIARRDVPGTGVVFCAPITGAKHAKAAAAAGLSKSATLRSLRVSGGDKAGLGAKIARSVAASGINMRGLSGAAIGKKAVFYLAFDTPSDATTAKKALNKALN